MLVVRRRVANGDLGMALIAIAPTWRGTSEWKAVAPSGVWRIKLGNTSSALVCNAYVQRDDVAFGRKGQGRQSTFLDRAYRRFGEQGALELRDDGSSVIQRIGTLNGLATGRKIDLAGGVRQSAGGTLRAARYSSVPLKGSPAPRSMQLALTEESEVCHGIRAAGTHSGSVASLCGTSMAAPQRTRELVCEALGLYGRRSTLFANDHTGARHTVVRLPRKTARP